MSAFLVSAAKPLLRPLIYLSVAAGLFLSGVYVGWDKHSDKAAKESLAAEYKAEQVRQATEDGWRRAHWDLAYEAEEKRAEREKQTAATIACLRDGSCRMRDRFTCPKVPSTTGTGPEPDSEESGLLVSDAQFLVQFAAEADTIADERNQCIASYNALRNGQ